MHDDNRPSYDSDQLLILCELLAPGNPSLGDEVRLAVERPDEYLAAFEERLSLRGIHPGEDLMIDEVELAWIALLDGLEARDRLAELDWKADPVDVMWSIDRVLGDQEPDPERWTWVDVDHWDNQPTNAFLLAIGERFLNHQWMLACFGLSSDSYPLTVVDEQHFVEIQQVADQAGYGRLIPCIDGNLF